MKSQTDPFSKVYMHILDIYIIQKIAHKYIHEIMYIFRPPMSIIAWEKRIENSKKVWEQTATFSLTPIFCILLEISPFHHLNSDEIGV